MNKPVIAKETNDGVNAVQVFNRQKQAYYHQPLISYSERLKTLKTIQLYWINNVHYKPKP